MPLNGNKLGGPISCAGEYSIFPGGVWLKLINIWYVFNGLLRNSKQLLPLQLVLIKNDNVLSHQSIPLVIVFFLLA